MPFQWHLVLVFQAFVFLNQDANRTHGEMVIGLRAHERNAMTFSTSRMLGLEAVNHVSALAEGKVELSTYKTSTSVFKRFRRRNGVPCDDGKLRGRR